MGSPSLFLGEGENLIPPFCPANHFQPELNWLGENLSRKEWPEFQISVNKKEIFSGAVFNAIYRWPDCEFSLPERLLKKGSNSIEIKLTFSYPSAPCFILKSAEILAETAGNFEIVSFPEYAGSGKVIPVLIQTNKENITLAVSSKSPHISIPEKSTFFKKKGLYAIHFKAKGIGAGGEICISSEKRKESFFIKRIVERTEDHVILSTGDAVYVPQTVDAFRRYFAWYASNRIGNGICFRPVYRWCGSREMNASAWVEIVKLCNEIGLYFSLMSDGRELSGMRTCPPNSLLNSPFYMGRQSHEQDGSFNYWGHYTDEELFGAIFQRYKEPDGIFPGVRPVRRNGKNYSYLDPESASNVKEACENFIKNIQFSLKYSTRHTGPSVLFRYFYQAGYPWLGAEQMYGPEDVILSALRGASRAYGKDTYGAHLAVQWSSGPPTEPEHFNRYFLSLALCYLHGVNHINTEEGLWRMEANYAAEDRFGHACREHLKVHQQFFRFVATHSRRGKMRVPIGIIQGHLDGWRCYIGEGLNLWAQNGEEWKYGLAEQSFNLLHIFYPRSKLDSIYRFPCPHKPQGWYTGTPYGHVDIAPIEAELDVLSRYQGLVFLGWNTFKEEHFEKLVKYVERGGALLLSLPHLSTNLKRGLPVSLPNNSPSLKKLLGLFLKDGGICSGKEENPLPYMNQVGKGQVIFFNTNCYPADSQIRSAYEDQITKLAATSVDTERKCGWIKGNKDVNFSVYDWGNGLRTAYLLDINWWEKHSFSPAALLLGEVDFPIKVIPQRINVITIKRNWAIFPQNEDVDIVNIIEEKDGIAITLQGDSPSEILLFHRVIEGNKSIVIETGKKKFRAKPLSAGVWNTKIPLKGITCIKVKTDTMRNFY